jgi:hypothetical protein
MRAVSFLGIHKSEPKIYIGFSRICSEVPKRFLCPGLSKIKYGTTSRIFQRFLFRDAIEIKEKYSYHE